MPRIQRPAIEPNIEGIAALLTSVVAFDAKGRSAQLLKVHARVWILSRLAPKRFGEKPEPDDELIRDCDLPQSGEPFSIFRSGPHERRVAGLETLAISRQLLKQKPPNSFLGDQHYGPFPLPDETERGIRWRGRFQLRAEECRTLAGMAADDATREGYLKVAGTYESMAKGGN